MSNSDNFSWNPERIESQVTKDRESVVFYERATVVSLLSGTAVSISEAVFLVGSSSIFYYLLIAGGLLYVVVAAFCLRGSNRAFQFATRWAILRSLIAVALGGTSPATVLFLIPQFFIFVFSRNARSKIKQSTS
jgi:hypothetical protein